MKLQAEDHSGKWARKVSAYRQALRENDPAYLPIPKCDALVDFLFPELRNADSAT